MLPAFLVALFVALALLYVGCAWLAWVVGVAILFAWRAMLGIEHPSLYGTLVLLFGFAALATGYAPLRRVLLTRFILPLLKPILPRMSDTERVAIEAGTVWWEAEFFTGRPNWRRLLNLRVQELTPREQAFVDHECEELCSLVHEWDVHKTGDLPSDVWELIRRKGFMGMIIPEEYGGLGFSAAAHSQVVTKLSTRSVALAVTVMVPNSLGPAELLLHYGTEEQKRYYLPRLARGDEIPAFALTEPRAGSDAGAMRSTGVVCEGTWQGKRVLGMRLDWDKRYITLAPVATVLGLAFKLEDPEHHLGDVTDLGITCALVPTNLKGVEVGRRHDPLGCAFMNGPTSGHDVFVPLDAIIGGRANAGQGWKMLMQSLATGRGISLPSMASGAAKLAARTAGAYATVREQFKTPIGRFEGVAEKLAAIGATTYAMDAARRLTVAAVDAGERPSVASAIAKRWLTEDMRRVTNDAMDILGGAGICLGPKNILGGGYAALPIGITVEGANILTRSMIVFGQGAIRCHPFVQGEMKGAAEDDLVLFDRSFFGHVGFVCANVARSFLLGITDGRIASSPAHVSVKHAYERLTRTSACFALLSDVAMGTLGGSLKSKESITGRLADALAYQFLASAALKRFHDEGNKERDLPFVTWYVEHALFEAQQALDGVLRNLPLRPVAWALRPVLFPLGRRWAPPRDRLAQKAAAGLLDGALAREHLTMGMYLPPKTEEGLGVLEDALEKIVRAQGVLAKVHDAVHGGTLEKKPYETQLERARQAGVVSAAEMDLVAEADRARGEAIAVDAFEKRRWAEMSA